MAPRMQTQPAQAAKEDVKITLEDVATATTERYGAGRFAPKNVDELWKLADQWYAAELLPESYYPPVRTDKRPGFPREERWKPNWRRRGVSRAVIVMRYGASLGVLPEQSLRSIYIVEGQPSPSAQLMLALCISNGFLRRDDYQMIVEPTKTTIKLFTKSKDAPEVVTAEYAEYRHLHNKSVWQQYPKDMVCARAIARMVRRYFPDVFAGVYCAEERIDLAEEAAQRHSIEAILEAVDIPPEEAPPELAPLEPPPHEPGSLAEQEALVSEVTKLIAELPADAAPDDPRRATIKEKGERIQGSQRAALAAAYDAKCRKAPSRG